MSRRIVETWFGVDWVVKRENLSLAGADGQPLFEANGVPKTQPVTTLVFTRVEGDSTHVVKIPFSEDAKAGLIAGLTGGIVVPSNGHPGG